MLRKFITRIYRQNSIIFWVLSILILIICFLTIDIFIHIIPNTDTISRGQLLVETIGLVALIVAIFEFVEISKKPNLRLWAEILDSDKNPSLSKEIIDKYFQKNSLYKEKGIVDQDIIKDYIYHFRFKLYIENFGQRIGRFIKVTMKLTGSDSDKRIRDRDTTFNRIGNNELGIWLKGGLSRGTQGKFHRFHGGEKFVAYSHPAEINNLKDWLEYLGEFDLKIPVHVEDETLDISLLFTIQAEDFELETQKINVKIPIVDVN